MQDLHELFPKAKKIALVTDSNVDRLYGDETVRELESTGFTVERIVFPAGEASKTMRTYAELLSGLAALTFTRNDALVALGGGVVTDLGGFAAATYMRGIAWAAVPTSLLGMVDASVGGKTGVDLPEGKNLAGAFWKPVRTLRDMRYLETLPRRELMNGYAEMVKMAVLFDPALVDLIERDLPQAVARCVALKEAVVEEDFREGGRRKLLNLGHTFGHGIEQATDFAVPHGEAVAMGMRIVSRGVPEVGAVLDRFGLGLGELPDRAKILEAMRRDKKRSGDAVTLVVPRRLGACELVDVPIESLSEWL